MKTKKIFHGLYNYGTQSGLFAKELKILGYDAISVVNPDNFKRLTDVELKSGTGIRKFYFRLWNFIFKLHCFFKYNIFHFYYGKSLLPYQIDLPFYKYFGKKIVMEYLGNDIQGYQLSIEKYKWTNVKYLDINNKNKNYDLNIRKNFNFVKKHSNKLLVCAPMYSEFVPNSEVLPLCINLNQDITPYPVFIDHFRIMHAPTHRGQKGTDFIVKAVEQLKLEGYNIYFDLVENVNHDKLIEHYEKCHLFIDQILGGWYGTASIEAMSLGRPVIVFIREEYFNYVNYGQNLPVINSNPDNIYQVLKNTLDKGYDYLHKKGINSRKFVEEYHDVRKVTKKLISIYNEI